YAEVLAHPREKSDEYRREATAGSTLIPLLSAWLIALGQMEEVEDLVELKKNELGHCTLQLWLPDSTTEELIYRGGNHHGVAVCPPLISSATELLQSVYEACRKEDAFGQLTAVSAGHWPIILL